MSDSPDLPIVIDEPREPLLSLFGALVTIVCPLITWYFWDAIHVIFVIVAAILTCLAALAVTGALTASRTTIDREKVSRVSSSFSGKRDRWEEPLAAYAGLVVRPGQNKEASIQLKHATQLLIRDIDVGAFPLREEAEREAERLADLLGVQVLAVGAVGAMVLKEESPDESDEQAPTVAAKTEIPLTPTTPCPSGSFSFQRLPGRIMVEKKRAAAGDVVLVLSFLAMAVIVYSFIYDRDLIPQDKRFPFVATTICFVIGSIIWKLRVWLGRERLLFEFNTLSYFRAKLGIMTLRQRFEGQDIKEVRAAYLGKRGHGRYSHLAYGLVIKTEDAYLEILEDSVSQTQLEWIAQTLRAEIAREKSA